MGQTEAAQMGLIEQQYARKRKEVAPWTKWGETDLALLHGVLWLREYWCDYVRRRRG